MEILKKTKQLAVSDIKKIKPLPRDLDFDVREGEEMFTRRFKNSYRASLLKNRLLSEDFKNLKNS